MTKSAPKTTASPSELIDERIASLDDWRGPMLARLRAVITKVNPGIVEEWKWNVPVWSCDGIICTGEVYKSVVKLTFAHGASLDDPTGLFNSRLLLVTLVVLGPVIGLHLENRKNTNESFGLSEFPT